MAPRLFGGLILGSLSGFGAAQQAGVQKPEVHPWMKLEKCTRAAGCEYEAANVVLDASRRWLHDATGPEEKYGNCVNYDGSGAVWDAALCPDPATCARNCAYDGVDEASYKDVYGISGVDNGIKINFKTQGNVGSRLYLLDSENSYKAFKLKNREIAFDVDVSTLSCGLNAAIYLVSMDGQGQQGMGGNTAGAKFGTGYCDAQCPHQIRFLKGEANLRDWDGHAESGHFGSCCTELDIFEGNKEAQAFTMHPCRGGGGQTSCEGKECGDSDSETHEHYMGMCDRDGCDFNPYRLGATDFYGPGKTVDTTQPMTVVTQFLTEDGTDEGRLAEVKRFYIQGGQVIGNAKSKERGIAGDSLSDAFCSNMKETYIHTRAANNTEGEFDQFNALGGLGAMGEAMDAGMVLVLSLWDDPATAMRWLDSTDPGRLGEEVPGVVRGPCKTSEGEAEEVEVSSADAFVTYANLRYGEIGSTNPGLPSETKAAPEPQPTPYIPPPPTTPTPANATVPAAAGGVGNQTREAEPRTQQERQEGEKEPADAVREAEEAEPGTSAESPLVMQKAEAHKVLLSEAPSWLVVLPGAAAMLVVLAWIARKRRRRRMAQTAIVGDRGHLLDGEIYSESDNI